MSKDELAAKKFGLPKVKKFPMPDAAHVRSAIKFFNYAKPSQERELANAILARMEEYGIDPDDLNVGDENRFKKYLEQNHLSHHGILGQKWGVRRYQNKDGSLTPAGRARLLNQYDNQLKGLTIAQTNALYRADIYRKKADKQRAKGNQKKADKFDQWANDDIKRSQAYNKRYFEIGEKYAKELISLRDSGLAYKIIKQEYASSGKQGRAVIQDILKKYGKMSFSQELLYIANASSGNYYKVADPSKLSDKKKRAWERSHSINSHRPQQVTYVYV